MTADTPPAAAPQPAPAPASAPSQRPRPRAPLSLVVLAVLAVGYTLWMTQEVVLPVLLAMFFALVGNPHFPLQFGHVFFQDHRAFQIEGLAERNHDRTPAFCNRRPCGIEFPHGLADDFMVFNDLRPNLHAGYLFQINQVQR